MKIQFSIYDVNRVYGGPEEGGWYWDAYQHVKSFERDVPLMNVTSWTSDLRDCTELNNPIGQTMGALERLTKSMNEREGKTRDLSSVLSNGQYIGMFEEIPGENQTKECPHYC